MHPSWEAQQAYLEALALGKSGRFSEARALYRKAIQLDPSRADFWNGLGFVFCMQGRYAEAVASYDRAIALDPSGAGPWNGRGYALAAMHDYVNAEDSFREAIKRDARFAYAWSGLGMIWSVTDRLNDAFNACRHASDLDPTLANAWFHMAAIIASHRTAFDPAPPFSAASCLCRAVHLQESYPQTFPLPSASLLKLALDLNLQLLALRVFEQGAVVPAAQSKADVSRILDEAKAWRDTAASLSGRNLVSESQRELAAGIIHLLKGDPLAAHRHMERADGLDETSTAIQYFLVISLNNFCEPAEKEMQFATKVAQNILSSSPPDPEQTYYAGLIIALAGMPVEAQRILATAPGHLPSLYARHLILQKLGRAESAEILSFILARESTAGTFLRRDSAGQWIAVSPPTLLPTGSVTIADIRLAARVLLELPEAISAAAAAAGRPGTHV